MIPAEQRPGLVAAIALLIFAFILAAFSGCEDVDAAELDVSAEVEIVPMVPPAPPDLDMGLVVLGGLVCFSAGLVVGDALGTASARRDHWAEGMHRDD